MVTIEGMPKFGLSMEEGVVSEWLVAVGARVSRGDAVATIESEKLVNSAKAPRDGVLLHQFLAAGDGAPCGEPLYALGDAGDTYEGASAAQKASNTEGAPEQKTADAGADIAATPRAKAVAAQHGLDLSGVHASGATGTVDIDDVKRALEQPEAALPAGPVSITPRAKKLAEKLRLSYDHIRGTGLLGMVTVQDVRAHGKPYAEEKAQLIAMTGVQRATAAAMKKSLENAAQTTVAIESGFAPLAAAYKHLKPVYAAEGVKLSYTAMIIKAAALAIRERPDIRMQYADASHFLLPAGVHIGMAVEIEKGLIVPVVRDADQKPLRDICRDVAALSQRARSGVLTEDDMGGAVMTVTNLAMAGVTSFTPILNPPESTILGVCAMREQALVHDGGIFIEPVMNLCLTYDHRVVNGAPAGRFIKEIIERLNTTDWQ